jgi:hypothetical protein
MKNELQSAYTLWEAPATRTHIDGQTAIVFVGKGEYAFGGVVFIVHSPAILRAIAMEFTAAATKLEAAQTLARAG